MCAPYALVNCESGCSNVALEFIVSPGTAGERGRGNHGRAFSAASLNPPTLPPSPPPSSGGVRDFRTDSYLIFHRCRHNRVTGPVTAARWWCLRAKYPRRRPGGKGAGIGREFRSVPLTTAAKRTLPRSVNILGEKCATRARGGRSIALPLKFESDP